jgi:hypothetical protein
VHTHTPTIEKGVENIGVHECSLRKKIKWEVSLKKIGNLSNLRLITLKQRRPNPDWSNNGLQLGAYWTETNTGKGRS